MAHNSNTYARAVAELPEQLCQIFSERLALTVQPLPNQITEQDRHGRQLYVWRLMGHQWRDIYPRYQQQANFTNLSTFSSALCNHVQR
jgi:hypothetical protein